MHRQDLERTVVVRRNRDPQPSQEIVPYLQVLSGKIVGFIQRLGSHTLTIGRGEDCHLVLDEPGLSRRHAQVVCDEEGYTLVDLGSTNGTYVGNQEVQSHRLQAGDRIEMGVSTVVKFARAPHEEVSLSERLYRDARKQTRPVEQGAQRWKLELLKSYALAELEAPWKEMIESLARDQRELVLAEPEREREWCQLANLLMQMGELEEAALALESALKLHRSPNTLWLLGRLYVQMGRSQDAIDYYKSVLTDSNERKALQLAIRRNLADLYFRTGHYQEALHLYALDTRANGLLLARVLEACQEVELAGRFYRAALTLQPEDARAHLAQAEFFARQENWSQARGSAELGLQARILSDEIRSQLIHTTAASLMGEQHLEEALAIMQRVCQDYPSELSLALGRAKLFCRLGRTQEGLEALSTIQKATRRRLGCTPALASLWSLKGDCEALLGELGSAEDSYRQALRIDCMDSAAFRGLGALAERAGKACEAEQLYERSLEIDPLNLAAPAIRHSIERLRQKEGLPPRQTETRKLQLPEGLKVISVS